MPNESSKPLFWIATIVVVAALVPIVAMTLAVAAIAWIPLAAALLVLALFLAFRSRTRI